MKIEHECTAFEQRAIAKIVDLYADWCRLNGQPIPETPFAALFAAAFSWYQAAMVSVAVDKPPGDSGNN